MDREIEPLPKGGALWGTPTAIKKDTHSGQSSPNTPLRPALNIPTDDHAFGAVTNKRTWIFAGTLIAVSVALLSIIGYVIFSNRIIGPSVDLATAPLDEVFAAAPFPVTVSVSNFSPDSIRGGTITAYLPSSFSFTSGTPETKEMTFDMPALESQQTVRQVFTVVSNAPVQSVARIRFVFRYSTLVDGTARQFEKEYSTDVLTSRNAIDVRIDTPRFAYNGKPFDFTIHYKNLTRQSFSGAKISITYPTEFQPTDFSAVTGDHIYTVALPSLAAQEEGMVVVNGALVGPANSFFNFVASAFLPLPDTQGVPAQEFPAGSQQASISIYPEPLTLSIQLQSSAGDFANPGDGLTYVITAHNNSGVTLQNATIRASFSGSMLDTHSISGDGVYDSRDTSVSWSAANTPDLARIEANRSVQVTVSARVFSKFTSPDATHNTLKIAASISSPTVPPNTAATTTTATALLQTKIGGRAQFSSTVFHIDPKDKKKNSGPYPPVANQATQYTVYWTLQASGAGLQKAFASTFLQGNTSFVGVPSTSVGSISYDKNSGKIFWNIGSVAPNTTQTATFQIENIPAITSVGNAVVIVSPSQFGAVDDFTGNPVSFSTQQVTTDIPDDTKVGKDRRVQSSP